MVILGYFADVNIGVKAENGSGSIWKPASGAGKWHYRSFVHKNLHRRLLFRLCYACTADAAQLPPWRATSQALDWFDVAE
jgi:hypothetical protein